jgi:NitT/TauT family transport system permease protein
MIRRPISQRLRVALGIASFVILALLYTGVSWRAYERNSKQTTIPGWNDLGTGVAKALAPDDRDYDGKCWLRVDSEASFKRLFTGLGLGCALGIAVGVMMGCYPFIEALLLPPLTFLAKIPPTAMLAVFFALVGVNFAYFVAMIAFGTMPTLAQAVHQAVTKDVHDELIHKARTLGASQPEVIWNVIFRQILPRVIDAVRLQVGPALVYLIAAEMGNADVGFGFRLRFESRLLHMNLVYVYLVYLGMIGLLIDILLVRLRRWTCPWFGE